MSAAVVAVAWSLPVVRELTRPASDVARAIAFFAHGSRQSWQVTWGVLAERLAAFPLGCVAPVDGPAWAQASAGLAGTVAVVELAIVLAAWRTARRLRRDFEAALALLALVLVPVLAWSIHRIVGPIAPHMVQWMALIGPLALLTAGTVLASRLAARRSIASLRRGGLVVAWLTLGVVTAANLWDACAWPARLRALDYDENNGVAAAVDASRNSCVRRPRGTAGCGSSTSRCGLRPLGWSSS